MVLHLIGLTFDVSDSIKRPEVLGINDSRPYKIPSLLEVFGFAYFPPTVIIGPQFSFKRYYEFLDKKYDVGQHFISHGMQRFATGIFYLAVYQLLALFVIPDGLLLTDEFHENHNFLYKMFMIGVFGRTNLYKYISCWILSEGATICSGELVTFYLKNKFYKLII
jgi:lysophospholipid acyltransferase 5